MTSVSGRASREGSGFISRDNDDPTAEATFSFMRQAGIPRSETVIWNVVPGWNGTRTITSDELRAGVSEVQRLLALVPQARAVMLVGQKARRAEPLIEANGMRVFHSDHTSPLVRARHRARWESIPTVWRDAAAAVGILR